MKLSHLTPFLILAAASLLQADVNVLIIGSDTPGDEDYANDLGNTPTSAFEYEAMAEQFRLILEDAGVGNVNVTTRERFAGTHSSGLYSSNLASWFYWPYGEWEGNDPVNGWFANTNNTDVGRWAELRGENGTQWDYVVLIGDPFTIESIPGYYTLGVSKIAEEVAKGSGETVLLMPWPATGSSSTLDHYKEVVYRTGRTAGIPVAPAGLAWQAAGSPTDDTHPSTDGAFIAAATLYSRLFGESASASDYEYNDTLADTAHTTVTNNQGAQQYSGKFDFNNPFKMEGDKRRNIYNSNRGTSTENRIRRWVNDTILPDLNVNRSWTRESYNSNTPDDDGLGWPQDWPLPTAFNWGRHRASAGDGITKSYFTNRAFWQLGFGFAYQATLNTDNYIGQMSYRELVLAYLMKEGTTSAFSYNLSSYDQQEEIATARLIPLHTLWAIIGRNFPDLSHMQDGTHINRGLGRSGGTFMYSLYSGRTPIEEDPQEVVIDGNTISADLNEYAQRVGYETAWILGNVQARAPGLKVTPASTDTSAAYETMRVLFFYQPQEDVTVSISVSDPALAEVTINTIVFTPDNYAEPVELQVRAKQRQSGSNDVYQVQFSTASDDEVFDNLSDSWEFNLPANAAPSATITSPTTDAILPANSDLSVIVDSTDSDGSVQSVTLSLNGQLVRQDTVAPYEWSVALGDSQLGNLSEDIYEIQVTAVDNQGESFTQTRVVTVGSPESTAPAIPSGFVAAPAYRTVSLDWDDNTEGDFLSYSIYRSSSSGVYGAPLAEGLTTSDYQDTSVENGETYYYVVTATDVFSNESALSVELEAVPQESANAIIFGSDNEGFGGFTTSSISSSEESWTELADSVRYINDDVGAIDDGNDGGTQNGSLLREFPLNRSSGASYRIEGIVDLTDGYGDDNNRVGLYLFGDSSDINSVGDAEAGAMSLIINTDNNIVFIYEGITRTELARASKTGTLQSDSLFGTELVLTADITFIGANIAITFTLRDEDSFETIVSTQVSAASYTGDYFGFVTRARTRGVTSSNRDDTWTMDYKSFTLADTVPPTAPTGFEASIGDGVIELDWNDNGESDFAGYSVYRGVSAGNYGSNPLATNILTSSYFDTNYDDGTTYYYAVTALDTSSNESPFSTERSVVYIAEDTVVDSDGDGLSDAQEILAGTDPNNASSRLQTEFVAPQGGGSIAFEIPMSPARYYRVIYKDALSDTIWQVLSGYENINGSEGTLNVEDLTLIDARFYQVLISNEPWPL